MEKKYFDKLIKLLKTIPGIVGFSNINDSDQNEDFLKFIQNNKSVEISLGIIIARNITTKNLESEIFKSLEFFIKKEMSLNLKKLNLYIKGVN